MLPSEKKPDPRVIRTRRDLIQSLCSLLKEKRFTKITVRDITDRAMINRATFYSHFEDKYAMLEEMLVMQIKGKLEENQVQDGRITAENLRRLSLTLCEFLFEFHAEHSPRDQEQNVPIERQIMGFLYEFLLDGIEKNGIGNSKLEPGTIATMISSLILGAALHWARCERDVSAEVMSDQIVQFAMVGLEDS